MAMMASRLRKWSCLSADQVANRQQIIVMHDPALVQLDQK